MAMNNKSEKKNKTPEKTYRGVFHYHQIPGGTLKFSLHLEDGPVKTFELVDDKEYHLTEKEIKHLNEDSGRYIRYVYKPDEAGRPQMREGVKVANWSFEVREFFKPEMQSAPSLFVVEEVPKSE